MIKCGAANSVKWKTIKNTATPHSPSPHSDFLRKLRARFKITLFGEVVFLYTTSTPLNVLWGWMKALSRVQTHVRVCAVSALYSIQCKTHVHLSLCFKRSLLNSGQRAFYTTQTIWAKCLCACVCVDVFPGSLVDGRSTAWRWKSGTVLEAAEAWLCP